MIITDPYDAASTGLKLPKSSADFITVSHQHDDHNNVSGISTTARREEPFVIDGPGEYEVAGVSILGIPSWHDEKDGNKRGENTIYIFTIEGMRVVHLGDLGEQLNEKQLELINGVDLLFIPVGGTYTLDPAGAAKLVGLVEPGVVIPMHYQIPGLKMKLAPVKDFLNQMGISKAKELDSLVISRDKLPIEKEVVVLNART